MLNFQHLSLESDAEEPENIIAVGVEEESKENEESHHLRSLQEIITGFATHDNLIEQE